MAAAIAAGSLAVPASAQMDPVIAGQTGVIVGTQQGYADRGHARKRGERPKPAVSDACMRAWQRHDRMTRAERNRLYDLCPR